jgi:hypothetical protein
MHIPGLFRVIYICIFLLNDYDPDYLVELLPMHCHKLEYLFVDAHGKEIPYKFEGKERQVLIVIRLSKCEYLALGCKLQCAMNEWRATCDYEVTMWGKGMI